MGNIMCIIEKEKKKHYAKIKFIKKLKSKNNKMN